LSYKFTSFIICSKKLQKLLNIKARRAYIENTYINSLWFLFLESAFIKSISLIKWRKKYV